MINFKLLGPIGVERNEAPLNVSRPVVRHLLALLLSKPGDPMSVDQLGEELWPGKAPCDVRKAIQLHVHRLRRALAEGRLIGHCPAGYAVRLTDCELDTLQVMSLASRAAEALATARVAPAAELYRRALTLWRGEPYAGVPAQGLIAREVHRWQEQRLLLLEKRIALDLRLGHESEVVVELRGLTHEHPFRETFAEHYMHALYRLGRQAEALGVYRSIRSTLLDQLGVDPGESLSRMHQAILNAEPWLGRPTGTVQTTVPTLWIRA